MIMNNADPMNDIIDFDKVDSDSLSSLDTPPKSPINTENKVHSLVNFEQGTQSSLSAIGSSSSITNMSENNHFKFKYNNKPIKPKQIPKLKIWRQINLQNVKQFLHNPIPQGLILQCQIERVDGGLNMFAPKYHFYLTDDYQHLVTIKKLGFQTSSKYIISSDRAQPTAKNPGFLGTIESNFMGTEFRVYDNGVPAEQATHPSQLRSELAYISYKSTILQTRQPKSITCVIPALNQDKPIQYKPQDNNSGLKVELTKPNERDTRYHEFQNLAPVWDQKQQSFTLNFNERVTTPSVKNFILKKVDKDGTLESQSSIQFGKFGKNLLNLDITYPFSPLQAFALVVSNLDYKFACE